MSSKRLRFLAVLTLIAALAASQWTWAQPDLSEIVSRLESRDIGDRIGAIRSLLRLDPPDEQVQPILEKLSEDPEPQVRVEALWAAYELLGAKSAELLENYYSDADRKVRESSVRAACRLWDRPRPKDLCRSAFDDPDFAMRSEVIDVLRENFPRDPDVAALMRKGLEDPSA
ncbi:MAG: HEAT repeat domain-containing protein, partial [Acidobacteriota bacterium]